MLTAANNEMLTRVGPGTPMGNLMREYWIPACLSSELKADGEPMRLMLLGEQLIAFRDTDGRVGIMEHRCPHRCASLFFGRNEEGGLRCVYHGWKFDVEGNCLDMPNVPPAQDFKDRIKAKAYKVVERAGFVWTYMGSAQGSAAAAQRRSADAARGRAHHARAPCASATGSSRSRATSTPRISASCMSAASRRRTSIPTTINRWARGRPRAGLQVDRDRLGHDVRGLPAGRAGHLLLPLRPLHVPVHHADAQRLLRGPGRVHA